MTAAFKTPAPSPMWTDITERRQFHIVSSQSYVLCIDIKLEMLLGLNFFTAGVNDELVVLVVA